MELLGQNEQQEGPRATELLQDWQSQYDLIVALKASDISVNHLVPKLVAAAFLEVHTLESGGNSEEALNILAKTFGVLPKGHLYKAHVGHPLVALRQRLGDYSGSREQLSTLIGELTEAATALAQIPDNTYLVALYEQATVALSGLIGLIDLHEGTPDRGYSALQRALAYEQNLFDNEIARERTGSETPADQPKCNLVWLALAYENFCDYLNATEQNGRVVKQLDALLSPTNWFSKVVLKRYPHYEGRLNNILGLSYTDLGLQTQARRAFGNVLEAESSMRADSFLANIRLAHSYMLENNRAQATHYIEAARSIESLEFDRMNRLLLSTLESQLDFPKARARHGKALSQLVDSWKQLPVSLGGRGLLKYPQTRIAVGEHLRRTAQDHGPESALLALYNIQTASTLARLLDAPSYQSTDTAALHTLVPPNGGLIALHSAPSLLCLLVLDSAGVEFHATPTKEDLKIASIRYSTLKARRPGSGARAQRRQAELEEIERKLTKALLSPIAKKLRDWDSMTIIGEDVLGSPGIATLPMPADVKSHSVERLGLNIALSYLPSLPAGLALSERTRNHTPTKDILLLTNPRISSLGQDPLNLSETQRKALLKSFEQTTEWLADKASHKQFTASAEELSEHAILEIFAHGAHDSQAGIPTGFWLSDGQATGTEMARISSPPLVILAVCSAGAGPERFGDAGAANLGGAFLLAGANCVMLAPADIELYASYHLLEAVNSNLAQGHSPAKSLQLARKQLVPDLLRDPYEWSLIRVFGLGHQPVF